MENTDGKFLVLENLTKDYLKPSILDLKMGTRMYSDFASETKASSQRRKCSGTTSSSLGVRFCGSYKYQVEESDYKRTDKYVGRTKDVFTLTLSFKVGKIRHQIENEFIILMENQSFNHYSIRDTFSHNKKLISIL